MQRQTGKIVDVPVVLQHQMPTIQQVQQTVEFPQVQHIDRIVDLPAVRQHQEPIITIDQKTVEVPHTQFIDRVLDVPVTAQRQVPLAQRFQKTVGMPQIQFIDKYVDAPVDVQADPEIELQKPTPVFEDTASVNPDLTDPMNPLLSITDGEGFVASCC